MKTRIEIDTRTFVRFWLVVIGFILAALAIYSSRTALLIIGIAFFMAIALSLPVNKIIKFLPSKSRVQSTALAYVAIVITLGLIVFLVIPPIIGQTVKFANNVPELVDSATSQYSGINDFINQYELQPQVDKFVSTIKDSATQFATGIGSFLVTGIGSIMSAITAIILVFVLTFLMIVEGPIWLSRLWSVYKDKDLMHYHRRLMGRMYNVVTGYVIGQLSVSAIAGFVAGTAVFILSLLFTNVPADLAIPTAVIVLVSSLIPLFGAMIGAGIVGLVLILNNVTAAIAFIIFFILYQQVEANYISPTIQSKRIDLSALAILVSITIGIYLFGLVGGIISIPIAGCIKVVAEDYFAREKTIKD